MLLVYPCDIGEEQARQLLKQSLQRDWERHRFWLAIDLLGAAASALLILVPGPNFIGYYFVFRIVGHYFSLRGARRALTVVTWTRQPSRRSAAAAAAGGGPGHRAPSA